MFLNCSKYTDFGVLDTRAVSVKIVKGNRDAVAKEAFPICRA